VYLGAHPGGALNAFRAIFCGIDHLYEQGNSKSESVQEHFYNKVDTSPICVPAVHMLKSTSDPAINIQGPEERSTNKCQS
jgi:hypothetical protein